jgi:flagellar biosynthesis protein FlhA
MVFVMLVPMPAILLDMLLAVSMTCSMLVLLSALYINRPVEFSVFPSLLLLLTLLRLSLNLASSRRILLHGNEGMSAAGGVIQAFGQFVVGGNYVVGFVLFLALIAIQFLVVSHGSVRTAEVTARFTLDAMPGKQMAIDADMNAGLIDEAEARKRRDLIAREAEFYGAMDGAARFNQRDAMATILITAINIVAGFLIGVFQLNIPFMEALKTYTVLTVGDGLVTMIPSLLVSVAGGLVVTRTSAETSLGAQVGRQLFSRSRPLWIAAAIMLTLALIPGLPKLPFFLAAAAAGYLARRVDSKAKAPAPADAKAKAEKAAAQESPDSLIRVDELGLEVGYALVPLVDEKKGGQLLQRIRALRRHLAVELGFVVPSVHITDNIRLKPREYVISLRGVEIGRWEMHGESMLAIASDATASPLEGVSTTEPAFGAAAKWVPATQQDSALAHGWIVVDQTSALATHLSELIKQFAHELLTRQETKRLLDALNNSHPKLVEELVPKLMSLGEVQKVLQQLLREHVSIRDLGTILEALVDTAPNTKSPVVMVETARHALARSLVRPLLDSEGKLKLLSLDPSIAEEVNRAFAGTNAAQQVALEPSLLRRMVDGLKALVGENYAATAPVLLCASPARFHLRRLLEPVLPKVVVLSPAEIPPRIRVELVGSVQ